MNDAALDWFLANCWPQIRAEVPDARLSLCGRICKARTVLPDCVDSLGEMTRHHLYKNLGASAVAINPTVAGTGLKIKTVEALAMGLPSVCLPPAIEGLETIADRFALVAEDGESFADACIALLTDRQLWLSLRESALELGKDRFSAEAVYSALDEAMGWTDEADRPPAADHISDIDEELPAELAAKLADLESLNLGDAIAQLLDREAARPGAPVAVLHAAARACLAHDLPSAAFDHILVALGPRPLRRRRLDRGDRDRSLARPDRRCARTGQPRTPRCPESLFPEKHRHRAGLDRRVGSADRARAGQRGAGRPVRRVRNTVRQGLGAGRKLGASGRSAPIRGSISPGRSAKAQPGC